MLHREEKKVIVAVTACLFALSIILAIWLPFLQAFRFVFGIVLLLFIPGFLIIEVAFPRNFHKESRQIDWIERVTLSFALSITVVSPVVYFFNQVGVAITTPNILLEILGLIVLLMVILIIMRLRLKHLNKVSGK